MQVFSISPSGAVLLIDGVILSVRKVQIHKQQVRVLRRHRWMFLYRLILAKHMWLKAVEAMLHRFRQIQYYLLMFLNLLHRVDLRLLVARLLTLMVLMSDCQPFRYLHLVPSRPSSSRLLRMCK